MPTNFATAMGLLQTITSAAKGLLNAREEIKVNDVAIQLQGVVLDLQSEMLMIQTDYQNILRSREDLEKKLIEQESWDKERAKYRLERVGTGRTSFVYAFNATKESIEPPHWICPNCYQDKKKSILQYLQKLPATWFCPRCKTDFQFYQFPKELEA